MIWRGSSLVLSAALAYALLRGWPEALPQVVKTCVAVLALVAGLGLWAKRETRKGETVARGRRVPRWLDYAAIATAVLALECGFLWLFGVAPRPLETAAIVIERHFRPEAAALRTVSGDPAEVRSGNWLWTGDTRRPLPKRTDFKPGTKPEVFLRLQDRRDAAELLKNRVYVRAFALGRYENAAWAPRPGKPLQISADDSGFVQLAPPRFGGKPLLHEVFHATDSGGQNVLTALQGATAAEISPLTRIDDGLHLLPPPATAGGYQYLANSNPMRVEDLPAHERVSAWPGAAGEFLALPESGTWATRLRSVARTAAGTGTVKDQLLRLQEHLRKTLRYSLVTSNPNDLDPIENFLFEEKRGHCEYFATAGALMARALGIPSRVAYGWAGGTWYDSAGLFVFRANEAHAWTEVWLENHGWVLMDPTPQGTGGERARVAAAGENLPIAGSHANTPTASPDGMSDADISAIALWLMAGFAVPAGLIVLFRGSRKFNEAGDPHGQHPMPAGTCPAYLNAWRRACSARGMLVPPGTTLRRQITRLPDLPDFAAELLAYHYGTLYENKPVDPHLENHLTRQIHDWEREFSGINNHLPHSHLRP